MRPYLLQAYWHLVRPITVACLVLAVWGDMDALAKSAYHITLIAGPITGHGKDVHEYEKTVTLIKHCLETSPNAPELHVSAHYHGWPKDPSVLERTDTILLVSDGSDQREDMHPFYMGNHFEWLERQMKRGCGLMLLHWSTFHPSRYHEALTEWNGAYFDYETGAGPRKWFSRIQTWEDTVTLATPQHPVLRGVQPFRLKDEYYYNLRFRENDTRVRAILKVEPPGGEGSETVAWAVERHDGSRGFGFTGGHFHESWWIPGFRRMLLNAVVWTAGAPIPEQGIQSVIEPRFKVLILTGEHHPAHDWKQTTSALMHAIELDPRNLVHVTETPEQWLTENDPAAYDALVMNYCNWERPGWNPKARDRLESYVRQGGGLAVIHFANGAFHPSLPGAESSDWPSYRSMVRRVWDHQASSGHDPYGRFNVHITEVDHPITAGLGDFQTVDELYYNQAGKVPVQALAYAQSKVTGQLEPMAWAHRWGDGRVFQTVLGHADASIQKAANLIQRGCTWAAGQNPLAFDPPATLTETTIFREGSPWKP
ncbi:MAG: ThuA domain-containing protein [Verrucomicrobiota bacterium]|nr:ThuA domain-containing protein [Verrucomicrobiota bacterium]